MSIQLTGSTLFVHNHTINGEKIVHSHPFCGNPSSHTHSSNSIFTISRILNPDMVIDGGLILEDITTTIDRSIVLSDIDANYYATYSISQLRAPPVKA